MYEQQKEILKEIGKKLEQLPPEGQSNLVAYANGYADACATMKSEEVNTDAGH